MIRVGDKSVRAIYQGALPVKKVYCGETLIWGRESPELYHPGATGDGYWDVNKSWDASSVKYPGESGGKRSTYFFVCKPNTTYRWVSQDTCDRFLVVSIARVINPMTDKLVRADATIYTRQTTTSAVSQYFEFTTAGDAQMVSIYYALNTVPDKSKISLREV